MLVLFFKFLCLIPCQKANQNGLYHKYFFCQKNKLTFRLLMSYIYGAPTLDASRSHTATHHSR